jgi:hypothetical protein
VVANFQASNEVLHRKLRALVRDSAGRIWKDTFDNVPVDTRFMQNQIRRVYSPNGLAFQVGWFLEDFKQAGLQFYPVKVEPEQPSLFPAYMVEEPRFKEELSAILRQFGRKGGA